MNYALLVELGVDACIEADPIKDGLVPQETIISLGNPMTLVWKVQEAAGYAKTLQNIERLQTLSIVSMAFGDSCCMNTNLAYQDTVVEVIVDDKLRSAEIG